MVSDLSEDKRKKKETKNRKAMCFEYKPKENTFYFFEI
jgi:hypothetical protein